MWCLFRYYCEFSCRKKILNVVFVNCLWWFVYLNVNSYEICLEVNYVFDLSRFCFDVFFFCNCFLKFLIMFFGCKEMGFYLILMIFI